MNKYFTTILIIFISSFANAQQITGSWNGALKVPSGQINIIFNIDKQDGSYQTVMDIPSQNVKGMKANSVMFEEKKITVNFEMIKSVYVGELSNDSTITGEWQQNGFKFPLIFSKNKAGYTGPNRPQTPKPPFPYSEKKVRFENKKAEVTLGGTLTIPNGNGTFPAVVLVSGSGPQNRDSELFGHKPFAVIADHLSRNGIAVLRYDDRGVGTSSTGDFAKATTYDFAEDAAVALEYLRTEEKITHDKVGLIGHSEGGLVGPIVAAGNNRPDFLVLLAAPGMEIDELMLEQIRLTSEASGASPEMLKIYNDTNSKVYALLKNGSVTDSTKKKIEGLFVSHLNMLSKGTMDENTVRKQAQQLTEKTVSPWYVAFMNHKPKEYLAKITGPVLALNGSKDLQVPAKQNLEGIRAILGKNKKVALTAQELPGLNHLFQTAKTGNVSEYGEIEETFSPAALKIISDWILLR
ncbi:S9 family peptidase [Dyadobacter sp. CY312]|uniref:alpha/beta hydrolase family protein n=1 Tax=Dyadobacter sp. CY312 TaxID=2907303 RepID=UPI001F1B6A80|nr:alpha/beta fold hydrolase [Dyadobacter sp. CY312]MCE7042341.1 alpha/beta hydrolase [Dyadobacter sp. CY312]